jgi:putative ABC transport system permease protein
LFSLLGVSPVLGRTFSPQEDAAGNRVVIISDELWEARFGRSAALDQLSLEIKGIAYRVIGIMPPEFRFPIQNETAQLWITLSGDLEPFANGASPVINMRNVRYLQVLGRLNQDVTGRQAEEDLRAIAAGLAKWLPETNRRADSCVVMPMLADITSNIRPSLILLMGAGGSVLGLACVNLANLLLARGSTRQKEVAVRRALGAGRGRILRQLLTESLVLALFGGVAGLLLGLVAIRGLVVLLPDNFPRAADIAAGIRAVGFTALIAVVTSCFFGFAPAWSSSHCALGPILNEPNRESTATRKTRRLRSTFLVIEMVLAFILLVAACLLLRNLWQLWHTPLGFNPSNLLTANLSLPESRDAAALDRSAAFYGELQARISRLEGVEAAAVVSRTPLTEQAFTGFEVTGRSKDKDPLPSAYSIVVTPNYFRTMGIALLKGRDFDERDERYARATVIVNDTLARLAFGSEDPVGKRIRPRVTDDIVHGPQEREIVGVVADVKTSNLTAAPLPAVYVPHSQCAFPDMTLVVRSRSRPEAVFDLLQETVAQMDASLPLFQRRTMGDNIIALIAQPRLNSMLLSAFALIATLLTAVGVYGSMAYSVAQRTHEIGIRLALGAQKVAIFRLVVGEGMRLTGWSLLCGALCSVILGRLLEKVVYSAGTGGMSTMPIITLVAALVFVVALIACWFPAQRASGVDPLHAIGQR